MSEVVLGLTRLVLLPAGWLGCYALMRALAGRGSISSDRRMAVVLASILWGALLAAITELASLGHAFNPSGVAVLWLFATTVLFWRAWPRSSAHSPTPEAAPSSLPLPMPPLDQEGRLFRVGTVMILGLLGVVAFATPSTGWDSLTYHLPRVMHWIQNGSVAHFATSNTREIESAPWASFAVAHTFLLYGNDRWANLVQWLALLLLTLTSSLIARQLADLTCFGPADASEGPASTARGNDGRLAGTTALLVVSLPAGALQAMTTYTDLVVSAWLLCAVSLGLSLIRDPGSRTYAWGLGGAVALGLLSKVTMLFYALPFLGLLGMVFLVRSTARRYLPRLALILVVSTVALNLPHGSRNFAVFGSPLGSEYMFRLQRNARFSPDVTISNAIRNTVLHTATGFEPLTGVINQGARSLHALTGLSLEDPETTFGSVKFYGATGFPIADNQTGNPYHAALILAAVGTLLVKRGPGWGKLLLYLAAAAVGFVGFCTYLRWQPWHARLHLPWFLALMPMTAAVMVGRWNRLLLRAALGGLFLLALGCVGFNRSRPLIPVNFLFLPREQQYFREAAQGYPLMARLAEDIATSGVRSIGLLLRHDFREARDDREYPYWLLPHNRGFRGRIDHVYVTNETRVCLPPSGLPEVVISTLDGPPAGLSTTHPYPVAYSSNLVLHQTPAASYWCRLSTAPLQSRAPQEIPHEQRTVTLPGGRLNFTARAGRPGVLHLSGWPRAAREQPLRETQLYVKSSAGCVVLQPNEGTPFAVELPLPSGSTAFTLALLGNEHVAVPNAELRSLQWTWRAEDGPLPWAQIVQVDDPNAAGPASPGTTFFRISADATQLQIMAGMDGTIALWLDAVFDPPPPADQNVVLLASVAERAPERVLVTTGLNLVKVQVRKGNNRMFLHCEGGPPATQIVVRPVELRFAANTAE